MKTKGSFTKELIPNLNLKLRLLSLIRAKAVVSDIADSKNNAKQIILNFGLVSDLEFSLLGSGLYFCKQRFKYGHCKFFPTSDLKCLKM